MELLELCLNKWPNNDVSYVTFIRDWEQETIRVSNEEEYNLFFSEELLSNWVRVQAKKFVEHKLHS